MECYCYLRNIQDRLSDGKTPFERRFGEPFEGSVVPFGSLVEYHPTSTKDQSRIHQFGKRVLPGMFLGYVLCAGRISALEANGLAPCSRPCLCFGGVLVHLHVPQILYFFLTSSFDLTWVKWSALDVAFSFPFLRRCFVSINRKNFQLRQRQTMLRLVVPVALKSHFYCWDFALIIVRRTVDE